MSNQYDDNGHREEEQEGPHDIAHMEARIAGRPYQPFDGTVRCETCAGPCVAVTLPSGARSDECPLCDRIPSSNKPAALFEAGEHPAFHGTWIGRALADFDEEPTRDIPAETMAQAVGR